MQVLLVIRAFLIKLDGDRALAVKTAGKVHLRSRNDSDFNRRYPAVVQALGALPDETVINSEIVGLEESGTPTFHALQHPDQQNRRSSTASLTCSSCRAGT
jgi:bifunctional non-homologous end joining protein LigD